MRRFRQIQKSAGCCLLALLVLAFPAFAEDAPVWSSDVTNALSAAKTSQRPVLMEFTAPWCPYCRQMEGRTFKDEQVQKRLNQFERVSVNIDHNAPLAAQYAVRGVPAFVILDPAGDEIAKTSGFMEAGPFNQWLIDGVTNLVMSTTQKEEFRARGREIEAVLASTDVATRAKGVAMVLDCCERQEKIYRTFGSEKLEAIAGAEPRLLLEGLNHSGLMARIRAANLLRQKLGDGFDIDPWDKADARRQAVETWKARLSAEAVHK